MNPKNNQLLILAEQYFLEGSNALAKEILKSLTLNNPELSRPYELLGYIYGNEGNHNDSFELLKIASQKPNCSAEALYYLGTINLKKNNIHDAIELFNLSIKKVGPFFEALYELGTAYIKSGAPDKSLECYMQCIQFKKNLDRTYFNIARCFDALLRPEEALFYYDEALKIQPNYPEAWFNKGVTLNDQKRYEEALTCFDKSINLKPDYIQALCNKGVTLNSLERYEEALIIFDNAITLGPHYSEFWANRGVALNGKKCTKEALASFDRAIELNPNDNNSLWNKSLTNLLIGNFKEGWELHDFRWKINNFEPYRHSQIKELKKIDGINGKKILVWHEQGLGDSIQFSRFIPKLLNIGAKVVFEAPNPLLNLFSQNLNCQVTSNAKNIIDFDFQIPLLSLPKLFKIDINNIPKPLNIKINRDKAIAWQKKLNLSYKQLNIGIAISGNRAQKDNLLRSIPLKEIEPLLEFGTFFLIQKELSKSDEEFLASHKNIKFIGDQLTDFNDTAAIVENMDLIISVCTSLIHLSGSLNKNSYLMSRHLSDWRWLQDRQDSPWYPSIKILRQKSIGDWNSVTKQVYNELKLLQKNN